MTIPINEESHPDEHTQRKPHKATPASLSEIKMDVTAAEVAAWMHETLRDDAVLHHLDAVQDIAL